jgi:leucyl aminopeptidase
MKGITIEVISTDAEGRLILADALTYSGNFKPDVVVDIATLTGACVVALGHHAAGVMGDDDLTAALREAGEMSGDRAWPLPLYDEYGEQIKSDYADLKNTGGRPGGSLTAGMFLSKFVPEGVRWAHVDMAGTATEEKGRPYTPRGGSGYGVRLLVRWLRNWRA